MSLDVVHADALQFGGDKFRRLLYIVFVFLKSADARDAEQVLQFIDKTGLIRAGKIHCWGGHRVAFLAQLND